jgi:AbiV family abortive infection protein
MILTGAYFAAEHAGDLLNDAFVLYKSRRWASALVLAAFCLEELGKAETLFERALKANKDGPMPKDQVLHGMNKHPTKLKAGRGPVSVSASVAFVGDIPPLGSNEMAELGRRLDKANEIALKNAPRETHQDRMRALYVDLGNYDWQRPADISSEDAYLLLAAAAIEYGLRREKFVNPSDSYVIVARKRMTSHLPELPTAPDVPWPQDL